MKAIAFFEEDREPTLDKPNKIITGVVDDNAEIYISRLEKEIKELKEQLANDIDRYEDTISYQLGFEKGKEEIKKEILEFVNNLNGGDKQEFMGYGGYELLEILGDKENRGE